MFVGFGGFGGFGEFEWFGGFQELVTHSYKVNILYISILGFEGLEGFECLEGLRVSNTFLWHKSFVDKHMRF